MIDHEVTVSELRKDTKYGYKLLVDNFYKEMKGMVSSVYQVDNDIADIIVIDSFLKIINNIESFQFLSNGQFRAWIITIVRNTAIDYFRKIKRDKEKVPTISLEQNSTKSIKRKKFESLDEDYATDIEREEEIEEELLESVDLERLIDPQEIQNLKDSFSRNPICKNVISDIMNSFSEDEQFFINQRLNGIPNKVLAKKRRSNEVATRKYTNRLIQKFFIKAGTILKTNNKDLYERFKEQNKALDSGSNKGREIAET